jgi:hypothetical protein
MHLPGLAAGTLGQARALLQAGIEVDEVEGAADPGDGRDHVQPAQAEIDPLHEDGFQSASPPAVP